MLGTELKARAVAAVQLFSALLDARRRVDWANGMGDTLGRELDRVSEWSPPSFNHTHIVTARHLGLARLGTVEGQAFCEQAWASTAVDGSVDTTAAEERLVGRIDYHVGLQQVSTIKWKGL